MLYNQPHLDTESVDWKAKLLQIMTELADKLENLIDGKRCMDDATFDEFIQDGNEILDYLFSEDVRSKFFSKTRYSLSGIETAIDLKFVTMSDTLDFLTLYYLIKSIKSIKSLT